MNLLEAKMQRRQMAMTIDKSEYKLNTMKDLAWPKEVGESLELDVTNVWCWDDVEDMKDPVLVTGKIILRTFSEYGTVSHNFNIVGRY